jgi:hypothetical protein
MSGGVFDDLICPQCGGRIGGDGSDGFRPCRCFAERATTRAPMRPAAASPTAPDAPGGDAAETGAAPAEPAPAESAPQQPPAPRPARARIEEPSFEPEEMESRRYHPLDFGFAIIDPQFREEEIAAQKRADEAARAAEEAARAAEEAARAAEAAQRSPHLPPETAPATAEPIDLGEPADSAPAASAPADEPHRKAKLCRVCGKDLAGRTRLRDKLGYICAACAKAEDEAEAHLLTCPDCHRKLKDAAFVNFHGTLICKRCYSDRMHDDKPHVEKVDLAYHHHAERRRLKIMLAIAAGLILLILLNWIGVI